MFMNFHHKIVRFNKFISLQTEHEHGSAEAGKRIKSGKRLIVISKSTTGITTAVYILLPNVSTFRLSNLFSNNHVFRLG